MAYDDIAGRPAPMPMPRPRRRRPATSDRHAQHMHRPAARPARLGVTAGGLASAPGFGDRPSYRMTKRRQGRGAIVPEGMATTADDAMWREQILALRQALMALAPAPAPPPLLGELPMGSPGAGRHPRMASEKFGVLDDSDVTTPHAFIRQFLR